MFTTDLYNNLGRHCAIDNIAGRAWRVQRAVKGDRYLVRNVLTGEHRTVSLAGMYGLY